MASRIDLLSVVIPAHNEVGVIGRQLEALLSQDCDRKWELVVVDHRSTDGTGTLAAELVHGMPNARVVRFDRGSNAAAARNHGVTSARGDAVAFCDADDIVQPGWVQALYQALDVHELVVGSLEYATSDPSQAYRAHLKPGPPVRFFGSPLVFSSNFACRRWVWEALGGFDETFTAAEDLDFGLRAHFDLGLNPFHADGAWVLYTWRTGYREIWRQAFGYGFWYVALMKRHAHRTPRPPHRVKLAFAHLMRLMGLTPGLIRREGRQKFLFDLGVIVGRFTGSFRNRYFYL